MDSAKFLPRPLETKPKSKTWFCPILNKYIYLLTWSYIRKYYSFIILIYVYAYMFVIYMWVGVDQRLTFNCFSILLFCDECVSGAQLAGSSSFLSSSEDYTQILEIPLSLSGLGASSFPLVTPTLQKTSPTKSGSARHNICRRKKNENCQSWL